MEGIYNPSTATLVPESGRARRSSPRGLTFRDALDHDVRRGATGIVRDGNDPELPRNVFERHQVDEYTGHAPMRKCDNAPIDLIGHANVATGVKLKPPRAV